MKKPLPNDKAKHFGSDPKSVSSFWKGIIPLVFFVFITYLMYVYLFISSSSCSSSLSTKHTSLRLATNSSPPLPKPKIILNRTVSIQNPSHEPTNLSHIVFGIASSSNLWETRKEYIKIWYKPQTMRGFVWLDKPVKEFKSKSHSRSKSSSNPKSNPFLLPTLRISGDTKKFPYTHKIGHRSAIRISRIVSETFRLKLPNVRWFVMGDDDTVFIPENLVKVLSDYDHDQPYYIGSLSESHLQNIYFSYGMAYGGGGFAISRPLAASLAKMQDKCLHRYPALYGSDDRIQACMAELGVPLTKHPGFHQFDVYGSLLGLLASHPIVPLVSLHHLDVVDPIFPSDSRVNSIKRLFDGPVSLDSAGVMQQSICYDRENKWTVSVSWGFIVQIVKGKMLPREMEMPARTFLNWYRREDYKAYSFNTRPVARNPCQKPYVYYMSSARYDAKLNTTVTDYVLHKETHMLCKWKIMEPSAIVDRIVVYKKPDPGLWDRSPRRNCCKVSPSSPKKRMRIEVYVCREGETSEPF